MTTNLHILSIAFLIVALGAGESCAATANPSDLDQYMLELVNRARMDPNAEAALFGISLNEGPPSTMLTGTPKQPLAFNTNLIFAAQEYSQFLLDNDEWGHTADRDPGTRITDAGYIWLGYSENIVVASYGAMPDFTARVAFLHEILFVDSGVVGRGHRVNILNDNRSEIGIGVRTGTGYFPSWAMSPFDAVLATQDFGRRGLKFLTGVVYRDSDGSNFYTPGEGWGGVTITATRTTDMAVFMTTTFSTGGYSLELTTGTYDVVASGGGLGGTITELGVGISTGNTKVDFDPDDAIVIPPPCGSLTCGDCNTDGVRSIVDALLGAQHAAGLLTLTGPGWTNCNVLGVQGGGGTVDIIDALGIAQFSAGLPVALACC